MSTQLVHQFLDGRSQAEKTEMLVILLRELAPASAGEPVAIKDSSGNLLGQFTPSTTQDDFFQEDTPGFYRELQRRRNHDRLLSAEEAKRALMSGLEEP